MARNKNPIPLKPIAPITGIIPDAVKSAYIARARQLYTMSSDDVEIDDAPDVGIAEEGAWVAAWVWVMQEEAGLYEKEATPNLKG